MKKYTLANYAETSATASSSIIDFGIIDSGVIDSGIVDSGLVDSGVVDPDDEEDTDDERTWNYDTYTEEEMEQMIEDGTWKGGFVEGTYYMPVLNVIGNSGSTTGQPSGNGQGGSGLGGGGITIGGGTGENNSEGDGTNDTSTSGNGNAPVQTGNSYPQGTGSFNGQCRDFGWFPGGGASALFSYGVSYRIEGRTMSLTAYVKWTAHREYNYTGGISVIRNGQQVHFESLHPLTGSYVIDPSYIYIGTASITLPYDGRVQVIISVGAVNCTEEGRGAVCDHEIIYQNY